MTEAILTTADERHPLMERVELITHLLKFSDRLFTIMSPDAGELKTFAELLMQEGSTGLHFAHVTPDLALTADDVAADLARAWGLDVGFDETASQAIEQRLPGMLREPRRAVAIINEVERLPRSALNDLVAFMQRMDGLTSGRVRLVLMGGPALAGHLQELKSLSEGGQIYALHLGSKMGEPATPAFGDDAGAGIDEGFDPLASPTEQDRPLHADERSGLPARTLLIGGIGLSLVLAIGVALLMRPSEPEAPKDRQVSVPLAPEKRVESVALPTTPAPQSVQPAAPAAVEPIPSQPAPIVGHQLAESSSAPAASTEPAPAPATKPVPEPVAAQPAPEPKPVKTEAPPPAPEPAPVVASKEEPKPKPASKPQASTSAKKNGNWFATQPGDHYVLQIVTAKSPKDIDTFIRKHGLKDCHSFAQKRDAQTLSTLTCGLYGSRDAAAKAVSSLPEKARSGSPYPRRIDDIRKVMLP